MRQPFEVVQRPAIAARQACQGAHLGLGAGLTEMRAAQTDHQREGRREGALQHQHVTVGQHLHRGQARAGVAGQRVAPLVLVVEAEDARHALAHALRRGFQSGEHAVFRVQGQGFHAVVGRRAARAHRGEGLADGQAAGQEVLDAWLLLEADHQAGIAAAVIVRAQQLQALGITEGAAQRDIGLVAQGVGIERLGPDQFTVTEGESQTMQPAAVRHGIQQ